MLDSCTIVILPLRRRERGVDLLHKKLWDHEWIGKLFKHFRVFAIVYELILRKLYTIKYSIKKSLDHDTYDN